MKISTWRNILLINVRQPYSNFIKYGKLARTAPLKIWKKLVLSLVMTHLDYVNSLLYGLPKSSIKLMQHIQNLGAKLILKETTTPALWMNLKNWHWLPVEYRIMFKCYCICFKVVNEQAPKYLDNMFITRNVSRNLRLNRGTVTVFMEKRSRCKSYGDKAFEIYGPNLWNKLPVYIKKKQNSLILRKF